MRRRTTALAGVVALTLAAATACSTKDPGTKSESAGKDGVKAGPGVTETTIKLGIISDLTGPFAVTSKEEIQGNDIYWNARNANGGVCGRKVEMVTKDMEYKPDKTKTVYTELKDQVLALQQSIGTPTTSAIAQDIEADKMVTLPSSNAASLLKNPYILEPGTTYEIETINALDFLMQEKGLKEGDTIGVIHAQGEYGDAGFAGAKFFAEKRNMKIVDQVAQATDRDMTSQVTALKNAGIKAMAVVGSPAVLNSAVSVAQAQNLKIPVVANAPGFATSALKTSAKSALEGEVYIATSAAPFDSPEPGPSAVRDAWTTAYGADKANEAGNWVNLGYALAATMDAALTKACEDKDLTREGLSKAARSLTFVDTKGNLVPVEFGQQGKSPSLRSFITEPDSTLIGGLRQVKSNYESPLAAEFSNR